MLGYLLGKDADGDTIQRTLGGAGVLFRARPHLDLVGELKAATNGSTWFPGALLGARVFLTRMIHFNLGIEFTNHPDYLLWNAITGISFTSAGDPEKFPPPACALERAEESSREVEQDREPVFKTPTPRFRLKIPVRDNPTGKKKEEIPENRDGQSD